MNWNQGQNQQQHQYQQVPQYNQYGQPQQQPQYGYAQPPQGQPVTMPPAGAPPVQYGQPAAAYPPPPPANQYQAPYQYPQPQGPAETTLAAPDTEPSKPGQYVMNADEVSDQMKFVRKVYSILALQLSLTVGFIVLVQTVQSFKMWQQRNIGISIAAAVLAIASMCAIICCFRRKTPHNYILLFVFTACESWMVGGLTARYEPRLVILAGLATALVTISLTIYAFRTKQNIEFFYAITFVVYFAMLPLFIIGLIFKSPILYIIYCALGLVFYSVFLIIDTMQIVKGKTVGGYALELDEYIVGALMLYIDIIMIFVYILKLLGAANNN